MRTGHPEDTLPLATGFHLVKMPISSKHQAENGAALTSPSVLSSFWGAKLASSWQHPQAAGRGGLGEPGGRPRAISPALLPCPTCLLAPDGGMWVFVFLKGLLRSLGIRLRDQSDVSTQPRAAFCWCCQFLQRGLCHRRRSTHGLTGVLYKWREAS